MRQRILLSVPHMAGSELAYVKEAFDSNWLSTVGPNIDALEHAIENHFGVPAVALSSGTAAIHLGLRLLGVVRGDEVFCPTLTFVATCNPVRYLGAEPVFLDSETKTWNMDPNVLEDALRERAGRGNLPRAVVVVHLYGQCADMHPIRELCGRYEIPILEDGAQAVGATYNGRYAGTMTEAGVFSFNGNKVITTTGGGMLLSRNQAWVNKARFWAQQARDPALSYEHSELGFNYRMSNVLAGIGRGQLEVLNLRIDQRRAIAFRYRDGFADLAGVRFMPQRSDGIHTNWLSCFLIDEKEFGCSRDELIAILDKANVESRPVWKPMHLQPLYAGCERYGGSVAEDLFSRGICLPSSSSLSQEDQLYVINTIRHAAGADAWDWRQDASNLADQPAGRARPLIPGSCELGADTAAEDDFEAAIEQLRARNPVRLNEEAIRRSICGKFVMVTGAAGSIGAELCRQIACFNPAAIVGFDIAESALFELDRQMRKVLPAVSFHAEIGSIQSSTRLNEVLSRYRPAAIYHAAAYKHVPLMETHVFEAVENNVLGTCNLAVTAVEHGVRDFVLISSDKAVLPTSVMGVTKRIAELALLAIQNGGTKFVAVRFGNVLDSTGSVIPIFRKQIAEGGPVTVTHPDMRRFFMTIHEAGQLVLQAAAIGQAGQICVLDMGRPVNILDLAKQMILSSGLVLDQDIRIEITGKRPGEKLYEELSSFLEGTAATEHENVRILSACAIDSDQLVRQVERLREACRARDTGGVVRLFQEIVPDYTPSRELLDQVGNESDDPAAELKRI
jgi:pyridoxal phosphate-dependent aminotransferase EpsN